MAGIDEQLRMREMAIAGNPQAAQQKYAQSKDLMDLLVAQKVSNDYTSARNAMQAATQTSANPIIDQLDMSNAQVTKNDMMRSLMPGVAIKAGRDQQAMQRQAMGIPSQPAPNIRMADGGIVGYAGPDGSQVQAPQKPILFDEMGKQITKENSSEMFKELTSYDPTGPIDPTSKRGDKEIRRRIREIERLTRPRQKAKMLDIPRKGNVFNTDAPPELLKQLKALEESKARIIAARNEGMADGGIVGFNERGYVDSDAIADENDESRFDVTDNELSPEEAIATDMQRQENMTVDQWMESIGKGAPTAEERARFEGTGTNPYAFRDMGAGILNKLSSAGEVLARQFGSVGRRRAQQETRRAELATEYPDLNKSQINYLLQGEIGKGQINPEAQAQAQTSGTPLGNRVPSKDARREQVADPFDVKGMVDRLVEPEFRMQGVLDAPQIKGPDKKKGMFDNVDIGRLQAFLAGGAGQTSTASALGEGLKGLMGEDQRRETLASKEAIEAAKISSQRYGVEQDFNAAMAKIGAEDRKMLFNAQADILKERLGGDIAAARDALKDMESSAVYQNEFMRLSAEYEGKPEVLRAQLAALTDELATTRQDIFRGVVSGEGAGAFEVELPTGD
jgi:hypothetical protein